MGKECQVEDCPRDVYGHTGYCEMHYHRVLRSGDPGPAGPLRARGICIAPDCEEPVDAKDLCHGHYQRLDRHGEIDLSPLRKGKSMCKVETYDRDAERRGYCQAHYKRVLKYGHPRAEIPIREVSGTGYINHGYRHVPVPTRLRNLSRGERSMPEHRLVMAKHLGAHSVPTRTATIATETDWTIGWSTWSPGRRRNQVGNGCTTCWSMRK